MSNDEQMLTPFDVANRLRISIWASYRLFADESFPSVKIGRLWRVREKDLARWIKERRRVLMVRARRRPKGAAGLFRVYSEAHHILLLRVRVRPRDTVSSRNKRMR